MKYRKKSIVIEATQWLGFEEGPHDLGIVPQLVMPAYGWMSTPEGSYTIIPGDWIITGYDGEKHPCRPAVFEDIYEAVAS